MAGQVLDNEVLNKAASDYGREFVPTLIDAFLADMQEQFVAIRALSSGGDLEVGRRAVHSVKSASKNVGAVELPELLETIEDELRTGSTSSAIGRIPEAEARGERLAKALEAAKPAFI
jgi:HPt (histidine-containing phosphotransfer) domain-containing protein